LRTAAEVRFSLVAGEEKLLVLHFAELATWRKLHVRRRSPVSGSEDTAKTLSRVQSRAFGPDAKDRGEDEKADSRSSYLSVLSVFYAQSRLDLWKGKSAAMDHSGLAIPKVDGERSAVKIVG